MIEGRENIRDIFSIFHDGVISSFKLLGSSLVLHVEVEYLAQRINPGFTHFITILHGVTNMSLTTWQKTPQRLSRFEDVFEGNLVILESKSDDALIHLECNQGSDKCEYLECNQGSDTN